MTEASERILDSVRGLLNWYGGSSGRKEVRSLHFLARWDPHAVIPPEYLALEPTVHVTKEMFADILYRTFKAAEQGMAGDDVGIRLHV